MKQFLKIVSILIFAAGCSAAQPTPLPQCQTPSICPTFTVSNGITVPTVVTVNNDTTGGALTLQKGSNISNRTRFDFNIVRGTGNRGIYDFNVEGANVVAFSTAGFFVTAAGGVVVTPNNSTGQGVLELASGGGNSDWGILADDTGGLLFSDNITGFSPFRLALGAADGSLAVDASGNTVVRGGTNTVYRCAGGTNDGVLSVVNTNPLCSGGVWTATALKLN